MDLIAMFVMYVLFIAFCALLGILRGHSGPIFANDRKKSDNVEPNVWTTHDFCEYHHHHEHNAPF